MLAGKTSSKRSHIQSGGEGVNFYDCNEMYRDYLDYVERREDEIDELQRSYDLPSREGVE